MTPRDPARDRLIAAARDLFSQRGFEGTSVRDITARARANLGAITYHFGSKEGLFHAVVGTIAEPLVEAVSQAALAPGTALERIDAITRAASRHLQAHPWAPRVLLRELAGTRPLPPPLVQAWKRNIGTLSGLVHTGQQQGDIRPGDPLMLALSVVGQVFFFRIAGRIAREVAGIDPNDAEVQSRIADHVAESVRRLLANPLPKVEP